MSIWKTPDQKPTSGKWICIFDGFDYQFDKANPDCWDDMFVEKWCDFYDLIAQADKAERLEEENEAMREEFEVWHGNHKCVLEDNERLQKQFDRAKWWLKEIVENHRYTPITTAEMALKELDDGNL